jgi:hypothetical protein
MANVGISVGTTVVLLASAGEEEARAVTDLVAAAAAERLSLEQRQSAGIVGRAPDRAAAEVTERTVFEAWKTWYARALESVLSLPVATPSDDLRARVQAASAKIAAR